VRYKFYIMGMITENKHAAAKSTDVIRQACIVGDNAMLRQDCDM